MAWSRSFALIVFCSFGSSAAAPDLLTEVTSPVYQTPGTPREIATRATTCIAQNLRPGTTDALLIVSSDLNTGVIVAQNALQFAAKANEWRIRSTFTFEAREGRFRINQTGLEMFSQTMGRWSPFEKRGVGKDAEAAFAASADAVAQCVIADPKHKAW